MQKTSSRITPREPRAAPAAGSLLTEEGIVASCVEAEIDQLRSSDRDYTGAVLNSICTRPLALASEVFSRHLATNLGDNRVFPSLARFEARVTAMLGDLLDDPGAGGLVTSGGTEANLLALLAALRRWREGSGAGRRPQVVVPDSVHYSFDKFETFLDFAAVRVRLDGRHRADLDDLRRKVTGRTALVIVTAGTSECGAVDDVEAAGEIARMAGVPLHVDAATGGFLVPFAREMGHQLPAIGFSVPGVTSITVDPHKYGAVPVPSGYLLFRPVLAADVLQFASHYRGTFNQRTLLGTRPGAGLIATYAALRHLGRAGYRRLAEEIFAKRDHLRQRLERSGHRLAFPPDLAVVGIQVGGAAAVLARLEARGLLASLSTRHDFLRVVVQHHLSPGDLDTLADALDELRSG